MRLTVVTRPASLPVSLEELKDQVRVAQSVEEDDAHLARLLGAATDYVERITRRALITRTLLQQGEAFPSGQEWVLPKPPLQSVTWVKYLDASSTLQTMPTSDYVVDAPAGETAGHGRIVLADGASWPSPGVRTANVARAEFIAGYGDAPDDVPELLRHAVLLIAAHWYKFRAPILSGTITTPVPHTLDAALWPYRALRWS